MQFDLDVVQVNLIYITKKYFYHDAVNFNNSYISFQIFFFFKSLAFELYSVGSVRSWFWEYFFVAG